jgi:proteasome assembly chaperone (PAC2) family protein
MTADPLTIDFLPPMRKPRLVIGFSGWMDGGEVSTGSVEWLAEQLAAAEFASIDPDDFYIYNFPGSMEVTALFRPYARIEEGLIAEFEEPANTFYCVPEHNLLLMVGKEPNLHWRAYVQCIFNIVERLDVARIYFVGSVGGLVTHTRDPRIMCGVSDPSLKAAMDPIGLRYSNYEGPVSIVTYLQLEAKRRRVEMVNFVAEIPAYVEGRNPRSIEAVLRLLGGFLELKLDLDELRQAGDDWEKRVTDAVDEQPELAEHVVRLEEAYDNEVFDTQMGDLKDWLHRRGVRLD